MDKFMDRLISMLPGKLRKNLHYEGKYSGDPATLKNQLLRDGSTKFREPEMKKFMIIANTASVVLFCVLLLIYKLRSGWAPMNILGILLSFLTLFPHEFIHAACFRKDVYMYTNLKQMSLFVVGSEPFTRRRFVFMSMLPTIIFGFIPFALFLIWPNLHLLGTLGLFAITEGAGDFINVYMAMTQMPSNALTYLYQEHSYWYYPEQGATEAESASEKT